MFKDVGSVLVNFIANYGRDCVVIKIRIPLIRAITGRVWPMRLSITIFKRLPSLTVIFLLVLVLISTTSTVVTGGGFIYYTIKGRAKSSAKGTSIAMKLIGGCRNNFFKSGKTEISRNFSEREGITYIIVSINIGSSRNLL